MMHNACFFSKHVLPYTNGTTRVVRVLSHCPYGLLANTYIPIEKTCETHTKTKQKFGIKSENSNLVRKISFGFEIPNRARKVSFDFEILT